MFDTDTMSTLHSPAELESLRRSAAMAPLPPRQVTELLDGYLALSQERLRIRALLGRLGPSWRDARTVLNELAELIGDSVADAAGSP